jgi:predicted CXXCH cytochrome family protein
MLAVMVSVLCLPGPRPAHALDPPHDPLNAINCINCHTPHGAAGGSITRVAGNPNLCLSCHVPGGLAAPRPFNDADQALPGVSGSSHRWDSGPSGHVRSAPSNGSNGELRSGGSFTGRVEKSYTAHPDSASAVWTCRWPTGCA